MVLSLASSSRQRHVLRRTPIRLVDRCRTVVNRTAEQKRLVWEHFPIALLGRLCLLVSRGNRVLRWPEKRRRGQPPFWTSTVAPVIEHHADGDN